jgi:hypothetical protein
VFHYFLYPEEGSKFLNRTVIHVPNSITSQKNAVMLFVEFNEAVGLVKGHSFGSWEKPMGKSEPAL